MKNKYVLLCCLIAALDCGQPETPIDEISNEKFIIPDGKLDNFFSTVAQEYMASAEVEITLDSKGSPKKEADKLRLAKELMPLKTRQVSWFLHLYLIDKNGPSAANNYGGLRAMVMYNGEENTNLRPVPGSPDKFVYDFKVQVGGTKRLLEQIRYDNNLNGTETVFPLRIAQLPNDELEELSHDFYKAGKWSPDTCNCATDAISIKLEPIPPSLDAYLDYQRLLEDKVLDIGVHFGWDYHARYDLTHSREMYDWLISKLGFSSPVSSFEKYNRLSGPLTKTVVFNGVDVALRVSIFHPDPCAQWSEGGRTGSWSRSMERDENFQKLPCKDFAWNDQQANANSTTELGADHLMSDLKYSLASRDVIVYTGHSGYTFGFSLANWNKTKIGDLDPPALSKVTMPPDKSQILLMNGCETYHTAQAFKDNPSKKGLKNLDVITTTSFSDAASLDEVKRFLRALVGEENLGGVFVTYSYGRLMRDLNPPDKQLDAQDFAIYGVHGIDDNPRTNPLGNHQQSCQPCRTDRDCGTAGNVCVTLNERERICAVDCIYDGGCAAGQVCRQFGSLNAEVALGKACVPSNMKCSVAPPSPETSTASF